MLISNIGSVVNKLGQQVLATDITCGIKIFDSALNYTSALGKIRTAKQQGEIATGISEVPFFMYNRSVLRYQNDLGKIGRGDFITKDESAGTALPYYYVRGEFDYKFGYISNKFSDIELFEIYYLTRQFPEQISVTHSDVDPDNTWDYGVVWGELDSMDVSDDGNHYTMISGGAVVSGTFLVFDDTSTASSIIQSIVSDIVVVYSIEGYLEQEGIT